MQAQVKSMIFTVASVAAVSLFAEDREYSDSEIKAQFVFAGRCRHAEDMKSNYDWAFHMADGDTNRYARILRELAVESTNETEWAIASLGKYKTIQSLPFLYSYATNAVYGAGALKSIFAIEGATSNYIAAAQSYLFMTNGISYKEEDEKSDTCIDFLKRASSDPSMMPFRDAILAMALDFQRDVELMPNVLDMTLCDADVSFRFSKRRLGILRNAFQRVSTELEPVAAGTCYAFQTNYLANAINELVAYPEANLPD